MSWSIEIYTGHEARLTEEELERGLRKAAPSLQLCEGTRRDNWALCDPQTSERFCVIQAASFLEETDADPELLSMLEYEIAASGDAEDEEESEGEDADDGIDAAYAARLKAALHTARWHYTVSAAADSPECQMATVRAAYGVAHVGCGLVHDMQSGAWMDATLFEEMLDAYGAGVPF